ncbi:MAG: tRNA (adenosine(37)-N6)-threonylcarbamoyltransferase complex ATPase subunit type 1 TsaE [Elusimicrobia bacterium RIFOXYA2_FULL_58_8]|nr:MAG: tRNA (adenosine(37)-N6)-threonylcarbamoyltransferase complex ATPase subunit type 1 TsaE [Elusimicrobia bacterium RIFOXYA2_FULL_58_8]OGS13964.1 MAG: tRNA (adenosine(37)-N6)-threonylcarbamoyltransferase complex ATPase subunit type 1 TsaE [Elusimicrobia bacterium RIFOXYA12_FULL_57_11]
MEKLKASSIFKSFGPGATARLAGFFAQALGGGETLLLEGPIGSGKTFFTRELARALGARTLPVSASFNLMRSYEGRLKLYHFDLFRAGAADLENIGLEDYLGRRDGVTVIEWAGVAAGVMEGLPRLILEFELAGGDRRVIKAHCRNKGAGAALVKVKAEWRKK